MYWISLASLPALRDASRHGQNGTAGVVLLRSLQSKRSVSKTISRITIFADKITICSFMVAQGERVSAMFRAERRVSCDVPDKTLIKNLYDAWASPTAGALA